MDSEPSQINIKTLLKQVYQFHSRKVEGLEKQNCELKKEVDQLRESVSNQPESQPCNNCGLYEKTISALSTKCSYLEKKLEKFSQSGTNRNQPSPSPGVSLKRDGNVSISSNESINKSIEKSESESELFFDESENLSTSNRLKLKKNGRRKRKIYSHDPASILKKQKCDENDKPDDSLNLSHTASPSPSTSKVIQIEEVKETLPSVILVPETCDFGIDDNEYEDEDNRASPEKSAIDKPRDVSASSTPKNRISKTLTKGDKKLVIDLSSAESSLDNDFGKGSPIRSHSPIFKGKKTPGFTSPNLFDSSKESPATEKRSKRFEISGNQSATDGTFWNHETRIDDDLSYYEGENEHLKENRSPNENRWLSTGKKDIISREKLEEYENSLKKDNKKKMIQTKISPQMFGTVKINLNQSDDFNGGVLRSVIEKAVTESVDKCWGKKTSHDDKSGSEMAQHGSPEVKSSVSNTTVEILKELDYKSPNLVKRSPVRLYNGTVDPGVGLTELAASDHEDSDFEMSQNILDNYVTDGHALKKIQNEEVSPEFRKPSISSQKSNNNEVIPGGNQTSDDDEDILKSPEFRKPIFLPIKGSKPAYISEESLTYDDDIPCSGQSAIFKPGYKTLHEIPGIDLNNIDADETRYDGGTVGQSLSMPPESINMMDDSYDRVPLVKAPEPGYAYVEVVRGREARRKLDGHACKECDKYFDALNLPEEERKKRLKDCSRHKAKFAPPSTPPHFWSPGFPTTQECNKRGQLLPPEINNDVNKDSRPRRKKPLKKMF